MRATELTLEIIERFQEYGDSREWKRWQKWEKGRAHIRRFCLIAIFSLLWISRGRQTPRNLGHHHENTAHFTSNCNFISILCSDVFLFILSNTTSIQNYFIFHSSNAKKSENTEIVYISLQNKIKYCHPRGKRTFTIFSIIYWFLLKINLFFKFTSRYHGYYYFSSLRRERFSNSKYSFIAK